MGLLLVRSEVDAGGGFRCIRDEETHFTACATDCIGSFVQLTDKKIQEWQRGLEKVCHG